MSNKFHTRKARSKSVSKGPSSAFRHRTLGYSMPVFSALSDDAPPDFARTSATFKFRLRVGSPRGPDAISAFKFTGSL